MNKKAIEALVATVLLVLITIAAVGIIWGAIMPIIRSNLATSQQCSGAELRVNTESGYTYQTGNTVFVQVSRSASNIDLKAIQVKVVKTDGSSLINTSLSYPSANSDKIYTVTLAAGEGASSVGVAPIIAVGNTNFTCPMTETSFPK